ncbi:MAG: maleylacetate reductase [Solirubrobacterales bacterium]|nr:maleylacetate reductase [Solirubrobacterales bacterium]
MTASGSPAAAMSVFHYDALPGRIIFGNGSSRAELRAELERLGARRVLVIATGQEAGRAGELVADLDDLVAGTFTEVRPHVPIDVAGRGCEAARRHGADALLSVGGGSTTGTAKAIALETGLPIVAIPTTYAGSEVTPVWGRTEGARKTTGRDLVVLPRVVIYDPELTVSLPAAVTGPSAMNAIAHCVEAFYAPGANPITSLLAAEGIRALASGVRLAVREPDNLEGREQTLYGAWLAGSAFASAGSGLHHKICHALGGAYDLPHAETHTIVLPHVVAFNAPAIPAELARIGAALGVEDAARGLQELGSELGAPAALRDVGLGPERLDDAVAVVAEKDFSDNPRPVSEGALRGLLDAAVNGRAAIAGSLR